MFDLGTIKALNNGHRKGLTEVGDQKIRHWKRKGVAEFREQLAAELRVRRDEALADVRACGGADPEAEGWEVEIALARAVAYTTALEILAEEVRAYQPTVPSERGESD